MPNRSQRHILETRAGGIGGGSGPPITNISPDTATLVGAGATGRTVATLTATGGVSPYTWSIVDTAGLAIAITGGNLITTTVNPYGTAGAKTIQVSAWDAVGTIKTEPITVTVT